MQCAVWVCVCSRGAVLGGCACVCVCVSDCPACECDGVVVKVGGSMAVNLISVGRGQKRGAFKIRCSERQ